MSWKGNDKYYWNEDTIEHFITESNFQSKEVIREFVADFVYVNCQLENGDTEEELVKDLMSKIYE
tara:strand:+ start:120 stop:314 length:195 start_codon:yes stop_codon:yes gene_type:complete